MHPPEQADARAAFERWALSQAGCPRDVGALVETVQRTDDLVGLMHTEVQGRRAVWKSVSCEKARVTFPAITLESVDAWSANPAALREGSEHVASCHACSESGQVACQACTDGKQTCNECGGQRKMYGYAVNGSRRLLNCRTCRGKGALDCPPCRGGVATCSVCGGSGRVQRWIELEWWQRAIDCARPEAIERHFGWGPHPTADTLLRDAEIVVDLDRPRRLIVGDLGRVPTPWLAQLAPALEPDERVVSQHLRIVRVPTYTVGYRLGSDTDAVAFFGRRLTPPARQPFNAFNQRRSTLRAWRGLLLLVFLVIALLSLARGFFYWSWPTFLSLIAAAAAFASVYGGIADWTATRRKTHRYLLAAGACGMVALALAFAAMPRLTHAQNLLAAGRLDAAERELKVLGDDVPAHTRADVQLMHLQRATNLETARAVLAKIPPHLPQHRVAAEAVAQLTLRDAATSVDQERWNDAANAIVAARALGAADAQLAPLSDAIRTAAREAVRLAEEQSDPAARIHQRVLAEAILVAWERSTEQWGTPALIELRTDMARDVALAERAARRRRR